MQLGRFGANGNVNVALTAAQKHDMALRSLVSGAEIVIVVCGIGGGTGSAVAPILTKMAQYAGALTLGVVVIPFRWEYGRYKSAFEAVRELDRHSHYLVSLPNEKMAELLGVDATLDDLITHQEQLAKACIQRLMLDGSRFCIERWRRPA